MFHIPLIVCDTRARAVSDVVEFHIISCQSHDIVLGFNWLHTYSPHINWWACTLSVKIPGRHCLMVGLTCNSIAHVELTSLDSIFNKVDHVSVAWLRFIHPVVPPDAMGICSTLAGGECGDTYTHHWDDLCTEFADVFEPPSIPQERKIMHRIELFLGTTPPSKQQYRMSPSKLAKMCQQFDKYLNKGWVCPSTSPYGAPILLFTKKDGGLRIYIDCQVLNKQMKLDHYPLPQIDDLLDRLTYTHYLSSIDLISGYH